MGQKLRHGGDKGAVGDKVPRVPIAIVHASFTLQDDFLFNKHPDLYKVLEPSIEEGKLVRQPGNLRFFVDGGVWFAMVCCPTEQLQAIVPIESLETALDELDQALKSQRVRWVPDYKKKRKERPVID